METRLTTKSTPAKETTLVHQGNIHTCAIGAKTLEERRILASKHGATPGTGLTILSDLTTVLVARFNTSKPRHVKSSGFGKNTHTPRASACFAPNSLPLPTHGHFPTKLALYQAELALPEIA